ncbi:hypothetical protein FNV43_RR20040 [Rhamnella rubrinervis]|uniref:Uncharacterized protein n=1 Tax=Rhamnella rubrinervis TaxID=2594499 RepID=A0A8K0E5P4_9ROSA|nr:hypothetical protein FNV43_RR20040 [Rhamnella rubrinervis]
MDLSAGNLPFIVNQALFSLLKCDFPLKLSFILFLEEFSDNPLGSADPDCQPYDNSLHRLIDTVRVVLQTPINGVHVTFPLKEHMMISVTSILL